MESEWVGFHEVPGILLVRLMSRCNERCVFCMVADEIEQSADLDYLAAADRITSQPAGTQIEFFGGEPTIYPRFLDLLTVARQHGYYCSVATNMRIFHSEAFTRRVASLDASQIYMRTSIYGDSVELHDRYTATRGSYRADAARDPHMRSARGSSPRSTLSSCARTLTGCPRSPAGPRMGSPAHQVRKPDLPLHLRRPLGAALRGPPTPERRDQRAEGLGTRGDRREDPRLRRRRPARPALDGAHHLQHRARIRRGRRLR